MVSKPLRVAIIGAGMGGLACAAALHRIGAQVTMYEQARIFARIGAGIQMTPNAVKALFGPGLIRRNDVGMRIDIGGGHALLPLT